LTADSGTCYKALRGRTLSEPPGEEGLAILPDADGLLTVAGVLLLALVLVFYLLLRNEGDRDHLELED
jgi:hypothetical protein